MKTTFSFILLFFSLISCNVESEKTYSNWHKNPIRFITENPDSPEFEKALKRYFEIRDSTYDEDGHPISHCRRNCLHVIVNLTNNSCMALDEILDLDSLNIIGLKFLSNPTNSEKLSEKMQVVNDLGAVLSISQGVFFIDYVSLNDEKTRHAVRQVCKALAAYKNEVSLNVYNKSFSELTKTQQEFLDSTFGNRIHFNSGFFPPPPPPDSLLKQINPDTILELIFEEDLQ